MTRFGYSSVEVSSTNSLKTQRERLLKHGANIIIPEGGEKSVRKYNSILPSGNPLPRNLDLMIEKLKPGDQIIVVSLNTICWTIFDCLRLMDEIHEKKGTLFTLETDEEEPFPSILFWHGVSERGFNRKREKERLELEAKYGDRKIRKNKKIDYYLSLTKDVPRCNLLSVSETTLYRHCEVTAFVNQPYNLERK